MESKSYRPSHRSGVFDRLGEMFFTKITIIIFMFSAILHRSHAQNTVLTYKIQEEQPPMTTFGHIVRDSNIGDFMAPEDIGDLGFSFMAQGNPFVSYLWVNSTTGELKTFSRIDRETVCNLLPSCEFRVEAAVQAQKFGTFFTVVVINIEILDINDNRPTFDPPTFNLQIPEDETIGARFRLPSASDPDKGQGFSVVAYDLPEMNNLQNQNSLFSLIVDGRSSSDFVIHLRLENSLDREETPSYQLFLEAKDGGSPSLTGTLTINVEITDVNDNSPIFERPTYEVNISEITKVNEDILTVKASDLDTGANGKLVYSMPLAQANPVVFSMFAINASSGAIKTKTSLDPYAGGSFSFVVEVRDAGTTPLTATTEVTIHIKDTHNSDPEILLNVFPPSKSGIAQVSEMAELGRTVAYVAVTDPDSSLTLNGIVTCSVDSNRFELQATDVDKYKVILTRRLDRETDAQHSLTVYCEDSGSPPLNSSKSFVVEVLDENDKPPVFESSLYTVDVEEGPRQGRSGEAIIQVRAKDADLGQNAEISYQFANSNADSDFGIYADGSIVITNADGLDREDPVKGQIRELIVLAVDGGKPALTGSTKVKVTIEDTNDNAPQFSEPLYYFSVLESAEVGTIVNNVSATDKDSASNGLFYFRMDEIDERSVPFRVSPEGNVIVSGKLDREKIPEYRFHLIAHDIGQPNLLSSSVLVNMHIGDINDNQPIFSFPNDNNRTLHIPHTLSVNTGFGHIAATDLDVGKNGQLRYASHSGNGTKYIEILPDTGEIVLIRTLTMKDLGPHYVTVAVHDMGQAEQLATQSVLQIIIYEGNATVAVKDSSSKGFRNVVVVVVLVVVTVALGLAILLTILLIQRVDKKRRRYHAKEAEAKVDSNLRHLNPVLDMDIMEAAADMSDKSSGGAEDSSSADPTSRKKKEVSFSLDEDMNKSGSQSSGSKAMTSFGQNSFSDKYDAIPERERGNMKSDLQVMSKKDQMSTFHQVNPMPSSSYGHRQDQASSHPHDDNLSDVSGDVSTSDSGRGGSDVELQSHGGHSKDSGDPAFHNNLNMGGVGRNCHSTSSNNSGSNMSRNISNSNSSIGNPNSNLNYSSRNIGNKSVHFQNIRPEPLSSFRASASASPGISSHPTKPPRPVHNSYNSNNNNYAPSTTMSQNSTGRYTPNIYVTSDDEGSYVKLANHSGRPSSRPANEELDNQFRGHHMTGRHDIQGNNPPYPSSSSNQRYTPTTFYPPIEDNEYMDVGGARGSFLPQRTGSNPHVDGAGVSAGTCSVNSTSGAGWDGDTTTSGSYTVDPHELCEEIDKLFFEEVQDVVV